MSQGHETKLSRRGFFKAGAMLAAGSAATGLLGGLAPAARAAKAAAKPQESRFAVCDMCFNRCGMIARLEDGVIVKLDPNPKFTKSRAMLCARGNAGVDQVYDPDRLRYPLLRVGARGEGKWRRIPWDEALDLAASKMKDIAAKYTPCGHLFSAGADLQSEFVSRLAECYGSFNVTSHESLCLLSLSRAFLDTFGEAPYADVINSNYVLMAGANRFEALVTPDSIDLMTAMRRGCKLVVLDPRYTKTAALANEWHPIRPGTDMAFMLAVANVLIAENLYNSRFVAEKTFGFEQLAAHVAKYTPEFAQAECEIPAEAIRRVAREMAAAAPAAVVYPGRRSSDYVNSSQIRRSFAIVNALLGNWDQPGGLLAARQVGLKGVPFDPPWHDENKDDRIDNGLAPLLFEHDGSFVLTRDAILAGQPYPIKGWFVFKTNPMQTAPNRKKTIAMMEQMDFVTVVDITLSDTAWYADLVLPAPSGLERADPCAGLQGSSACACVVKRDPVIPAMYESRPLFDIVKGLSKRLGFGEIFDYTIADYRKKQLADLPEAEAILDRDGVYYNPSKVYGIYEGRIYKTKSQKIEIYNQRYAEMGLDPLPVYTPPAKVPEGRFRMVVGRDAYYTQGSSQNNALLHEIEPENALWINPVPAGKLGVKTGDMLTVESPAGKGDVKALVTDRIRPDTVYMLTGFGAVSKGQSLIYQKGACMAEVLTDASDAICGNAAMHETMVAVTRKVA